MYYKRIMMLDGPYVDAAGQRWDVCAAFRVRDAKGVNVGYEEFPSLEDALAAWGLQLVCAAYDVCCPAAGGV